MGRTRESHQQSQMTGFPTQMRGWRLSQPRLSVERGGETGGWTEIVLGECVEISLGLRGAAGTRGQEGDGEPRRDLD